MGEDSGEVDEEEGGLLDRPPPLLLLVVLLVLLSESLLALLIQLLSVGESESLSSELVELRFFLLDLASVSSAASSAWVVAMVGAALDLVSRRTEDDERAEDLAAEEDRVLRELLAAAAECVDDVVVVEAGLTPFSSK